MATIQLLSCCGRLRVSVHITTHSIIFSASVWDRHQYHVAINCAKACKLFIIFGASDMCACVRACVRACVSVCECTLVCVHECLRWDDV